MIKLGVIKKYTAILANLSLLLNTFLPFAITIKPVYAQSVTPLESTIEYNQSTNKLNVSVDVSQKIAYQLFYKTPEKIDAIVGNDLNQANQNDSFYLGTCSANSVCLAQNINRGILKLESGTNYYSKLFTLENNVLNVVKEIESSQSDLTEEENNFLEKNIINNWTFEKVELNKEYTASGVTLVFTKLPQNSGNIKIEEITLTSDQIKQTGSLSNKAYDITSDMADGTFSYNLSLPIPESAEGQDVDIKFAEDVTEINTAQIASNTTETNSTVSAINLNHFTVFMVTKNPVDCSTGIYVDGLCYLTIKDAINNPATVDGSVISVKSGTYNENIVINKSISLVGEDKNNTIINGGNSGVVVTITASNVTLKNFTVKNSGINPLTDAGIGLNGANNCTINSNIVTNNVTNIAVMSSRGNIISGNTISNSFMYGIVLEAGIPGAYSTGNIISENIINANGRDGIYAGQDNNNNQILNNKITGTIGDNTYGVPEGNGIYFWKSAVNTVTGNNISSNATGYGIEMYGSKENTITGNEITGNLDGLHIRNINETDYPGYSIKDNNISKNKIFGNTRVNLYASPNFDFNIEKNWWGSADKTTIVNKLASWTLDGNITAGTIVYLDFDPWCVTSDCSVYSDTVLSAPINLTPTDNTYTNNPAFSDTWSPVIGAAKYEYRTSNTLNGGNLGNTIYSDNSTYSNYNITSTLVTRHNSGTPQGTYYWQVRAISVDGTQGNWSVINKVVVDTTAPSIPTNLNYSTINNTALVCNSITNQYNIIAKWNASTDTNFSNYEYKSFNPTTGWVYNGGNIGNILSRTGAFTVGEGKYGFAVRAVDKAGNVSNWTSENLINSCQITYDATAPIITLDTYTTTLTNQNITVTAHTNEGNLNVGSTTFTANGSFTFTAVDNAGNTSTNPVIINNIDKTAPIVDITFPNNGDILKGNVTISGTIVDDNPHHYYLVIQNSQGNIITGPGTVYQTNVSNWIWDTTKVSDGTYIIDLEARDAANNKDINSTKKITVTVNNIAPDAPSLIGDLITYIKPGNAVRSWNKSNSSDVVSYIYKSFTSEAYANDPDNSPGWTPTPTNANGQDIYSRNDPTGDYERIFWWRVAAVDTAGNKTWSNDIHKIVVDKTAPTLKNKTIFSDSWYKNDLTSTFTYTDTNGVISGNNLTCDITTEGSSQTCSITPNVCDAAGNCNTTTVISNSVNLDKTTPISTIDGGENKDTIYSNSWNGSLSGTATDDLSGVAGVQISIKNGSGKYYSGSEFNQDSEYLLDTVYNDSIGKWTYSGLTNPLEDSYTVNSHATDNANNLENTYTLTIILDKTISEVGISLNPTDPDTSNGWYKTQPEVTLTQTDINFDKIEYQWDSQTGNWTTYLNSFKPTSQGSHILYYRAVDKAGNISTVGIKNIKWDNAELEFGPQNISANPNPTSGSTSKITWEAAKDNNGIDKYEIQWTLNNSSENKSYSKTVNSNTYETEIDQLIEGRWTIKVIAYDASGKSRDNSIDLVVDRTASIAPTLTLTNTGTGTASLSWNAINDAKDYIIWYGSVSGVHQFGARVGNVTSYTVKGLGAGNYYFIVKAVDEAQNQSADSNEINTGTIIGAAGTTPGQPAQGFSPEVLGATTDNENQNIDQQNKDESGKILGVNITKKSLLDWWWLSFLLLIPVYVIFKKTRSKNKSH